MWGRISAWSANRTASQLRDRADGLEQRIGRSTASIVGWDLLGGAGTVGYATPAGRVATGTSVATNAASELAKLTALQGANRGAAAVIVSGETGTVYTGLSVRVYPQISNGGTRMPVDEGLEAIANGLARGCSGNGAACAEVEAMSRLIAAEGWNALRGSTAAAAQIGPRHGGQTGNIINPCRSCDSFLTIFGVGF